MAQLLPSGSCDLTVLFNIECFLDCTQSAVYCALHVDCQKESVLKKPLTWLSVFVGLWLSMMKPLIDQVNHKFTLVLTVDNEPCKAQYKQTLDTPQTTWCLFQTGALFAACHPATPPSLTLFFSCGFLSGSSSRFQPHEFPTNCKGQNSLQTAKVKIPYKLQRSNYGCLVLMRVIWEKKFSHHLC